QTLPPGPLSLPIIGSLHRMVFDQPHITLAKLAKTHGPLMFMRLGSLDTVVVSSSEMAREVLHNQDMAFSSRGIPETVRHYDYFQHSVIWLPVGLQWRLLRKVLNTHVFSSMKLEKDRALREKKVEELISYCDKCSKNGSFVDVGRAAFRTSLNLISNTMLSMDLSDPSVDSGKELKKLVWNILVEAGKWHLVDYFPFLEKLYPFQIDRRMYRLTQRVHAIFQGLVNERLAQKKNEDDEAAKRDDRDLIDVVLDLARENPEEINHKHIQHLCLDLFEAGTHAISCTVEWAMAELIRNPETMEKARRELESVVGRGNAVRESDIQNLHYLECVVKETIRLHPVGALIPRQVTQVQTVAGYTIPENSKVLINAWAIGRDPENWPDPLEFKPERFVGGGAGVGGLGVNEFEMIPFGGGRRICPGQPLAVKMVPVMVGTLINCFDWTPQNEAAMDMGEKFGINLQKAKPL
ncbi:geraniol 10-hydroxylase, partial [Genlisea aurea]